MYCDEVVISDALIRTENLEIKLLSYLPPLLYENTKSEKLKISAEVEEKHVLKTSDPRVKFIVFFIFYRNIWNE